MFHIGRGHFAVADRRDAVRIAAADVAAGNARVDRADFATGHEFGFLDRALDRLHSGFDIHHNAALEPVRGMRADADHLDGFARRVFANDRHDFRRADVQANDQGFVAFCFGHVCVSGLAPAVASAAGATGGGLADQRMAKPLL